MQDKLGMRFCVRMVCIRVNKQVVLVKRVTLHVRLVFPLLRSILVHLGVVTAVVVLKDVIDGIITSNVVIIHVSLVVVMVVVFNVKETYIMLRMVLVQVPAYPKPNALKTI